MGPEAEVADDVVHDAPELRLRDAWDAGGGGLAERRKAGGGKQGFC